MEVYNNSSNNDIKIIIISPNFKVGKVEQIVGTIGMHSLHNQSNRKVELLINFASIEYMVIVSHAQTFIKTHECHQVGTQLTRYTTLIDRRAYWMSSQEEGHAACQTII